jgi:hypothetical protein
MYTALMNILIAAVLLCGSVAHAQEQAPRLQLWIGELLRADGTGCLLTEATKTGTTPLLTERDVVAWDAAQVRWHLDKTRFAGNDALFAMTDRCFVLELDGRQIRGAAVGSYSARWLRLPTLAIAMGRAGDISLRLSSMFNGADSPPLERATLDRILTSGRGKQ